MSNVAYKAFTDVTNGYDAVVTVRASTLAALIDRVCMVPADRANLIREVCQQLAKQREENDG